MSRMAYLELEKHLAGAICSFVSAEKLQAPIKRRLPLKRSPTCNNIDEGNMPIQICGVLMQHLTYLYTVSRMTGHHLVICI